MKRTIDFEAILAPIPGDNPAGRDLRYDPISDAIKEARRADDTLDRGEWDRDLKTSDWDKVITVSVDALTTQSKDLQIAVWLLEGLIKTEGYEGCSFGLKIIKEFFINFWEILYPEMDEDDLDYRIGPLEFANEKIPFALKDIPVTDPAKSLGCSLLDWQGAQQVAQANAKVRESLIAEGKISSEAFDTEVKKSSLPFFKNLYEQIEECIIQFNELDALIDEKFGREAPRLSEFNDALQEAQRLVTRFYKDKGGSLEKQNATEEDNELASDSPENDHSSEEIGQNGSPPEADAGDQLTVLVPALTPFKVDRLLDVGGKENVLWQKALDELKSKSVEDALEVLLAAACSSQSVREETNCKLLIVKLCLKAGRGDLAYAIAEEVNKLVTDLSLERWESPTWIADIYGCLYECLTSGSVPDPDEYN